MGKSIQPRRKVATIKNDQFAATGAALCVCLLFSDILKCFSFANVCSYKACHSRTNSNTLPHFIAFSILRRRLVIIRHYRNRELLIISY